MKKLIKNVISNKDSISNKRAGLLLTIAIAFIVFVVYFGINPITHLNTNYFDKRGDLMKDVFSTTYHVKYDSSYLHCGAMNYPYGDYYTYCGTVPYIYFPIKILYDLGFTDAPNYINGYWAFLIISSIFLSAIFLYLLLKELRVNTLMSMIAAVAITFLSPQIDRIGGHMTLSYICIYPMLIYFLVRHYKTAKYKYCIYYGLLLLFAGMSHPYYLITFVYISVFYCIFVYFKDGQRFNGVKGILVCSLLQLVIPVLLFYIIWGYGDAPADRTAIPWGFYEYRGRVEGLLFFRGRPFWGPLRRPVEWETICFIGNVSCLMLLVILIEMIIAACKGKFKDVFTVTDNPVLNYLFFAALLMTALCCIVPVVFEESMLKYLGPLAQMRAIGRFLFLTFYVLNVISVYLIYKFSNKIGGKFWPVLILVLTIGLYGFDVNRNCDGYKARYNNAIPRLSDVDNKLDVNQWVKEIDRDNYQAILPLPYKHVGSEHIWLIHSESTFLEAMYISMKTGLPLMANNSSRTPIVNTYKNVSITMIPIVDYPFLKDLPNKKPLLVFVSDEAALRENDSRIISYASLIKETDNYKFYSLEIDSLYKLCTDFRLDLYQKAQATEPSDQYFYLNWDSDGGCLPCKLDEKTVIYDGIVPIESTSLVFSFWHSDYFKDLHGRSIVRIYEVNENGQEIEIKSSALFVCNTAIYGDWGLIEIPINTSAGNRRLRITLENIYEPKDIINIDNLLIRPSDIHAVTRSGDRVFYDNLPVDNELFMGSDLE